MAGHPKLTDAELQTASRVYNETHSYAAAGEAVGRDASAIRKRLVAAGEPDRAALNALACERGAREARRRQEKVAAMLGRLLASEGTDGPGMEPRDIVGFANALTRNAETAIAFCDRVDRQRNYRLTRTKTKAEIAAIRSNSNTGGDINLVVRVAGDRVAVRADEAPGGDLPLSE